MIKCNKIFRIQLISFLPKNKNLMHSRLKNGAAAVCELAWVDFNFDIPPSAHLVSKYLVTLRIILKPEIILRYVHVVYYSCHVVLSFPEHKRLHSSSPSKLREKILQ